MREMGDIEDVENVATFLNSQLCCCDFLLLRSPRALGGCVLLLLLLLHGREPSARRFRNARMRGQKIGVSYHRPDLQHVGGIWGSLRVWTEIRDDGCGAVNAPRNIIVWW